MSKVLEIVAGPNGCGKTTLSEYLIDSGRLKNMINADIIAKGLDASNTKGGEITAGKIMLKQLHDCISSQKSVSFETTLSGKTWISLIEKARGVGYRVVIYYITLPDPAIAIGRIKERVSRGGHHIPDETVRRRFHRSIDLLQSTYAELADYLYIFDNSNGDARLILKKEMNTPAEILNPELYQKIFTKNLI
jgi:predicted ABC-type ATPase